MTDGAFTGTAICLPGQVCAISKAKVASSALPLITRPCSSTTVSRSPSFSNITPQCAFRLCTTCVSFSAKASCSAGVRGERRGSG
jgi:hypothetical protein